MIGFPFGFTNLTLLHTMRILRPLKTHDKRESLEKVNEGTNGRHGLPTARRYTSSFWNTVSDKVRSGNSAEKVYEGGK